MKHFNLASERTRIGMTQAELAEELGCTTKSLSYYENGRLPLPLEHADRAADIFGCSIDYLLDRTPARLPREG